MSEEDYIKKLNDSKNNLDKIIKVCKDMPILEVHMNLMFFLNELEKEYPQLKKTREEVLSVFNSICEENLKDEK